MSKNILDQYDELISSAVLFDDYYGDNSAYSNNYRRNYDADEEEDFITSKDIVKKMQENPDDDTLPNIPKKPIEIEEELYFKRFNNGKKHKYTQKELDKMRESCKSTIVHDYSEFDIYHISDEERAKNDTLVELGVKLGSLKRIYRKIDQYIEAMRVVVQAWELLEEKENYIHTEDEFYRLVSEGRIYNNRILMPKFKGIEKYNIDTIIKYISNPELDPKDLVPQSQLNSVDDWFMEDEDDESEEDMMHRLLSPEEVQFILDNADNPPDLQVENVKYKNIKGYENNRVTKKKNKNKSKKEKYYIDNLHDILKVIQKNPNNREEDYGYRSWLVTSNMFEQQKEEKDVFDNLFFDGSWANDDDLFLYDLAVNEELALQHAPGDRYITNMDKDLRDFFAIMESNGMNVVELRRRMNMSDELDKKKETKKEKKNNKKIEAALVQRITKLNDNPKFKKLINKAEKAINEQIENY